MRLIIPFLVLTIHIFGQTPTKKQIDSYVKTVDSLQASKKLKRYFYPEMSYCGGALYGYYLNDKLVLIDADHGGEFGNSTTHKMYIKDTTIFKILYEEVWADQDKYIKKYPKDKEIDEKKLSYTDTLYTIYLTDKPIYVKSSRGKMISKQTNKKHLDWLLTCGRKMRLELATQKISR